MQYSALGSAFESRSLRRGSFVVFAPSGEQFEEYDRLFRRKPDLCAIQRRMLFNCHEPTSHDMWTSTMGLDAEVTGKG